MPESVHQEPDQAEGGAAVDLPRTRAVIPVKSQRVRELPPPPKTQETLEAPDESAAQEASAGPVPAAPSRKRKRAWRPPWYRPVSLSAWKTLGYTCGLPILVVGTVLGIWNQAMRPGRTPSGHADAPQVAVSEQAVPTPPVATQSGAANGLTAANQAAGVLHLRDVGARQADLGVESATGDRHFGGSIVAPQLAEAGAAARGDGTPIAPDKLRDLSLAQAAGPKSGPAADLLQAADAPMKGKLNHRTPGKRSEAVRYAGATDQSEKAVEAGLRWLQAHQRGDGSWHFNHLSDACMHYCGNPGDEASTTAATALALLPFLGAGYTHKEGEYQELVQRGLDYIRSRAAVISYGTDLRDGSMYGHALATIALCEAYGMTKDPALQEVAQGGLKFIFWAQDGRTGGWRYTPGSPGDTTVTGWMLMAMKSGQMAGLEVQTPAIFAAERFLSSVQNADGSQYGYMTPQVKPTTTAVGLLCRMYTGWRRDHPGLQKGIGLLARWGPSNDNMYYNYYATQAMFHWAGPGWDEWNRKMRDRLISTQSRMAHESGSWYFRDPYGDKGGRLYNTALAIMILEVYYRYMPLYTETAVEKAF